MDFPSNLQFPLLNFFSLSSTWFCCLMFTTQTSEYLKMFFFFTFVSFSGFTQWIKARLMMRWCCESEREKRRLKDEIMLNLSLENPDL